VKPFAQIGANSIILSNFEAITPPHVSVLKIDYQG
jgi:hypothetical protein